MITAYLDETGIHEGAEFCIIAGYFGGKGQWNRFSADWRKALQDSGVSLEDFHALDLMKRRKAFSGWKDDRHGGLLGKLTKAITDRKIYPVSVGLVLADFRSFTELQRRFFTGATIEKGKLVTSGCPNKPYFLPFQRCTKIVVSYAAVGGKCDLFFGLDRPFAKYAKALFQIIKGSRQPDPTRERLGEIAFPLAKQTPPLQAADLLAYLTMERMPKNNVSDPPEGWLARCVANTRMPDDHVFFERETLRAALADAYAFGGFEGGAPAVIPAFDREEETELPD